MTRADDCAFPSEVDRGLTVREYMATLIMAGFSANPDADWADPAKRAVQWADNLIAALNVPPVPQ